MPVAHSFRDLEGLTCRAVGLLTKLHKRIALGVSLLLVVGVFIFFRSQENSLSLETHSSGAPSESATKLQTGSDTNGAAETLDRPPPRPDHESAVITFAPKAETVRKEVERDAHNAPESVLVFATKLAEKMEVALGSEAAASNFFAELKECVASSELTTSIRAICLSSANRLSQSQPKFKAEYQTLIKNTDAEVTRLTE